MARTVLLIDCCVHGEQSRTLKLARRYLDTLEDVQVNHQKLYELDLAPLSCQETVERKRTDIAKTFAQADEIVVAAPYWDLSFPSILKVYLEHVCVTGITFHYVGYETQGLCKAKKAVYISTAGGSTITQQLIKNLTGENQVSVMRKVKEIFMALNLEKKYTKDEILEAYLNLVNYGNGYYGVEAAAKGYFGKDIWDCNIAECATIAATTQNPGRAVCVLPPGGEPQAPRACHLRNVRPRAYHARGVRRGDGAIRKPEAARRGL